MWDFSVHDYTHCKQSECPKKDECYRYWLYEQDLKIEKETHTDTYCYYFEISPEQALTCSSFLSKKLV